MSIAFSKRRELEPLDFISLRFSLLSVIPLRATLSRFSCLKPHLPRTFSFTADHTEPQTPEDKVTGRPVADQDALCLDTVNLEFPASWFFFFFSPAALVWWMQEILLTGLFRDLGAFWYFSDHQESVVM